MNMICQARSKLESLERAAGNKTAMFTFHLVVVVGQLLLEVTGAELCETPRVSGTYRVTLSSRRNQTGHWLAQVQLERAEGLEMGYVGSAPVDVHIEQNVATCEDSSSTLLRATITAPPPRAGPGYEMIPGMGNYKFHTKSAVWWDARRICASEGAHLAIISSKEEAEVLRQLYARYPKLEDVLFNEVVFIGFHDLYTEGHYVTIFDQPLNSTGYYKWSSGQPDNAGSEPGEDCGSFNRNGLLNDLVCNRKHAFICEQELF